MQLITAKVKSQPRQVTTKHGDRCVVDIALPTGEEQPIWGPANFQAILNCRQGQAVTVCLDSKGKLHIAENQPETAAAPIQSPKAEGMPPETKKAIAAYAEEMMALYSFCYGQANAKLPDAPDAAKQSAASSVFIACQRKFSLT